jgi:hypothetical protein
MVPISKCFIFLFGCVNESKSIRTKWLCRKVKISVTFFYSLTRNYKSVSSQHNNPLCRIVPIENVQEERKTTLNNNYDMEKYREMTFLYYLNLFNDFYVPLLLPNAGFDSVIRDSAQLWVSELSIYLYIYI